MRPLLEGMKRASAGAIVILLAAATGRHERMMRRQEVLMGVEKNRSVENTSCDLDP